MANNWERFVILRAGKLSSVKGPGLFMIIPVIDAITAVIDERIQTTQFNAEQALTRDTVPVNVDAVIFWHVHDAQRAALNITDYRSAIDRVAQTSLREMIGASHLSALLAERKAADEVLRAEIARQDRRLGHLGQFGRDPRRRHSGRPAGRHVAPGAGRAREGSARHPRLAPKPRSRRNSSRRRTPMPATPAALHLRAMNIIYETTKERGATILMPTSMVDSMSVALPAALLAQKDLAGRPEKAETGALTGFRGAERARLLRRFETVHAAIPLDGDHGALDRLQQAERHRQRERRPQRHAEPDRRTRFRSPPPG